MKEGQLNMQLKARLDRQIQQFNEGEQDLE